MRQTKGFSRAMTSTVRVPCPRERPIREASSRQRYFTKESPFSSLVMRFLLGWREHRTSSTRVQEEEWTRRIFRDAESHAQHFEVKRFSTVYQNSAVHSALRNKKPILRAAMG
jgi:hypothetical protein